jgi:hypothetical protein
MGRNWKRAQPQGQAPRQFLTRQLFFKWIKQHLRIKAFFGTTENAVKTQIWIAVSVYVLVAIVKKRLQLSASLYEILQISQPHHVRADPDRSTTRTRFNRI